MKFLEGNVFQLCPSVHMGVGSHMDHSPMMHCNPCTHTHTHRHKTSLYRDLQLWSRPRPQLPDSWSQPLRHLNLTIQGPPGPGPLPLPHLHGTSLYRNMKLPSQPTPPTDMFKLGPDCTMDPHRVHPSLVCSNWFIRGEGIGWNTFLF